MTSKNRVETLRRALPAFFTFFQDKPSKPHVLSTKPYNLRQTSRLNGTPRIPLPHSLLPETRRKRQPLYAKRDPLVISPTNYPDADCTCLKFTLLVNCLVRRKVGFPASADTIEVSRVKHSAVTTAQDVNTISYVIKCHRLPLFLDISLVGIVHAM